METEKVVTEDIMASSAEEVPVPEQGVPAPSEPPVEPPVPPEVPDEKSRKSFLRACASWTDIFVIAAMLSVLLLIFGELLTLILDRWVIHAPQIGMKLLGDADSVEFLLQYFDFYGIWIAFMLVILLFKSNWPMWKAFLYNGHGNNLKAIPAGILLGFGMNGFCILMSVIMGDIKLSFSGFDPKLFFIFLFCVLIQSGAEEIIDRCYLYQKLRRRYRWPAIAVLVNALVLIGVLFSLIVYYWDSLWTVIWAHTAWNFSQSIVFGLPNSGIVSKYSVFKLEAASARDGIFYNTSFGVEGSMGANVMIAAAIVIVLIYGIATKRGERMDHWAEAEIRDAGKNHYWEAVVLTLIVAGLTAAGVFGAKWMNDHADEINQYFESQGIKPTESGEPVQVLPSESGEPAQTQ